MQLDYTIRRSTGPQDPWLIIAMNITELAWTDTDVQAGKKYHYVVTGVNDTGESGNSDEVTAELPGAEPAVRTLIERLFTRKCRRREDDLLNVCTLERG